MKHFAKSGAGQKGGCFKCISCGRLTRSGGNGTEMCGNCDEASMQDNSISDNDYQGDERKQALLDILKNIDEAVRKGGKDTINDYMCSSELVALRSSIKEAR